MTQPELSDKALALRGTSLLTDPYLRPKKIAEVTGKHYNTVTLAIRKDEMKAVRLGKRSLGVRASEVQRWLDSLQNEGEAA